MENLGRQTYKGVASLGTVLTGALVYHPSAKETYESTSFKGNSNVYIFPCRKLCRQHIQKYEQTSKQTRSNIHDFKIVQQNNHTLLRDKLIHQTCCRISMVSESKY